MLTLRAKVILLSSLFGVGCLVCAAAMAMRRRRRLKASKHTKEEIQRQLITSEVRRRRKQKTGRRRSSSSTSDRHEAKHEQARDNSNLPNMPEDIREMARPSDQATPADDQKIALGEVMGDLKTAIGQLEVTLRAQSTNNNYELHGLENETSISLEITRLQQLLQIASAESGSASSEPDSKMIATFTPDASSEDGYSSDDSFVSAEESIEEEETSLTVVGDVSHGINDLRNVDRGQFYVAAVKHVCEQEIPIRTYRTRMLLCDDDLDFCAKTYCIRLAFKCAFSKEANRDLFTNYGKHLISGLLSKADKDPNPFCAELESLIEYCCEEDNWESVEEELSRRGVCHMSFYDIVLDFVVMDALDDLSDPPYAVTTAIQNRWLSQSIKETALTTAIWSILAAKSRMLQNQDGFLRRMYSVSQHISPVLAWGLLGPVAELQRICNAFKDGLVGYLQDIFNTEKVSYESEEHLARDLMKIARQRHDELLNLFAN